MSSLLYVVFNISTSQYPFVISSVLNFWDPLSVSGLLSMQRRGFFSSSATTIHTGALSVGLGVTTITSISLYGGSFSVNHDWGYTRAGHQSWTPELDSRWCKPLVCLPCTSGMAYLCICNTRCSVLMTHWCASRKYVTGSAKTNIIAQYRFFSIKHWNTLNNLPSNPFLSSWQTWWCKIRVPTSLHL